MTNEEAKAFLDNLKICINEHPIVADWLVEIADRKTENCSEKPNNCEELNAYRECVKSRSFWDSKHCDGCYFDERCPFDEPQTDGYMTAEQAEDYRKMLDKAEHKVYGNIEDEPQTENLFTDKYGDVWEWRGDAWYCISGDEPQTERSE